VTDLSWATAELDAWHTDPILSEGRHWHRWDVTVFWRSKPFRDGRAVRIALRETLEPLQEAELPADLWATEDIAAFLLRVMAPDIVGVSVAREGFGGSGVGERS
jgi:hypothetical protein